MAWQPLDYVGEIVAVDNGGNKARRKYNLTAIDHATALADMLVILAAFEAVCAGGTVSYGIKTQFYNDALALPGVAVQAEAVATIVGVDSVNPLKYHTTTVPMPETDVFIATSGAGANILDGEHQDVIDYANIFAVGGKATISDGELFLADGPFEGIRATRRKRGG